MLRTLINTKKTIYGAPKIMLWIFFIFLLIVLLLTIFPVLVILFKLPNAFIEGMLNAGGPTTKYFCFALPLMPLLIFYIYFMRQYYFIEIIDDKKLIFKGWMIKSLQVNPDSIERIKRIYIYKSAALENPVPNYDILEFTINNKKIIVNNDIKDLDNLLSWIKHKNPNVILNNIDGKKNTLIKNFFDPL